ncbi:MAG: ATP-binding protein [Actinobacteria bacterium]|nr:ATP-binding protein [Actinomycetota bacterium]
MTSLLSEKKSKTNTCDECGATVEPHEVEILGRTKVIRGTCKCVQEKWIKEEAERLRKSQVESIKKLFDHSRVGERFADCTFENWQETPGTKLAYAEAKDFIACFDDRLAKGDGLLFYGPVGTGKSHLAAAIVNALILERRSAIFQSVPELLSRLRATYSDRAKEREATLLRALEVAELVVLDDIGAEKWSEWVEEKLYSIIDSRYRAKKPLIITSNLTLDEMNKAVGFRAMDRLIEMCRLVEVKGESFRRQKARQRMKRIK